MSYKKTVVGKILAAIISVFAENWQSFVAKLFNKIPDELKAKISIGIYVVNQVKTWLDGDIAKFLTHVIPGDLDEEIRLNLIEVLNNVLKISNETVGIGGFNLNSAQSHALASEINQGLTGLSFGQSALTTEVIYQNTK